jgi:FMN phosphatase YigB (HAD superfamily)
MVGDSVGQDIQGAMRAGMRAVLLHRSEAVMPRAEELRARGIPVIKSLTELVDLVVG